MKFMIRNLLARLSWGRKLLDYRANLKKLEELNQQNILAVDYIEQMFLRLLSSGESPLNVSSESNKRFIVSLTSYGERIHSVHLVVMSLLVQSKKVDKIVLWLAESEFCLDTLPRQLVALQNYGLEIAFCKDIKSYKKLIPALKKFPNDVVITFDDDVIYPFDHIERLITTHYQYPDTVVCHRAHQIVKKSNGGIDNYINWNFDVVCRKQSSDLFPVGVGGILYPPFVLDREVLNEAAFLALAPNADDIWFKVMAVKNNTKVKLVDMPTNIRFYLFLPSSQEKSLWQDNVHRNNPQLKAVLSAYPDVKL